MGTYLTEAVIQQLGGPKGLDARALAILKDFAHLANDATSELEGVIEFSVPQYKFTAMSNCGRDAVIRGLKLLKNKQLLVQVSRGNDYTKKPRSIALNCRKASTKGGPGQIRQLLWRAYLWRSANDHGGQTQKSADTHGDAATRCTLAAGSAGGESYQQCGDVNLGQR